MADDLIDTYLQDVRRHLPMTGAYRKRILEELRDHLDHSAAELESDEMTTQDAIERAIASLGPATQVAERFRAAATSRTRLLAVLAGSGGVVGLTAIRLANILHADGERLGTDVRYSLVWAVGMASAAAVIGLLLALALRLGPRRSEMKAAIATAILGLAAIGVFHLANDGTFVRGPGSDAWRLVALGAGVATATLLLVAIRRSRSAFEGATRATFAAMVGLAAHYTVLDQNGPLALIAAAALAVAWLWALVELVRERPLA